MGCAYSYLELFGTGEGGEREKEGRKKKGKLGKCEGGEREEERGRGEGRYGRGKESHKY